jgi:uncharacterized protein YukE
MMKRTLLLSMVFVFALVAIVNSAAIAQDQSHQNLKDMSELLKDISAQLSTGKMTPEAQKTAGNITQQASQLLQELAGLGSETHSKHQTDIKKMKKSWDPFAEQAATED